MKVEMSAGRGRSLTTHCKALKLKAETDEDARMLAQLCDLFADRGVRGTVRRLLEASTDPPSPLTVNPTQNL